MPPTMRCAANGIVGSPKNTQKYMPPNAMNAPASIADTKHLPVAIPAFVTPMPSVLASVSAGESASGFIAATHFSSSVTESFASIPTSIHFGAPCPIFYEALAGEIASRFQHSVNFLNRLVHRRCRRAHKLELRWLDAEEHDTTTTAFELLEQKRNWE